ncbi:MAG: Hsp20/alpha crystallin family protein [Planctomycetota bacterium]
MSFFNRHHFFAQITEDSDIVEDFFGMRNSSGTPAHGPWHPPVDVFETADGIVVRFEVAGLAPQDLSVRVVGNTLQLKGVRKECCNKEKKVFRQMEIHYGPFERSVPLPCPVITDKGTAEYNDGILEIYLPKGKTARKQVIIIDIK